jgi:hypothetical protein
LQTGRACRGAALDELSPLAIGTLRIEKAPSFRNFGSNLPVDLQTTDVRVAATTEATADRADRIRPAPHDLRPMVPMDPRGQRGRST